MGLDFGVEERGVRHPAGRQLRSCRRDPTHSLHTASSSSWLTRTLATLSLALRLAMAA